MPRKIISLKGSKRTGRPTTRTEQDKRGPLIAIKLNALTKSEVDEMKEYYGQSEYAPIIRMALKTLYRQMKLEIAKGIVNGQ